VHTRNGEGASEAASCTYQKRRNSEYTRRINGIANKTLRSIPNYQFGALRLAFIGATSKMGKIKRHVRMPFKT
jgi:hypothetical protein